VGAVERSAALFGTASDWASVFRPLGRAWLTGERVVLAPLGRTLTRLAEEGPELLYSGAMAARAAYHLASVGSPIRQADLAAHSSTWADPIRISYRGIQVNAHPPNSSGAIALELLGVLARFPSPEPANFGPTGMRDARWVHRALEAARLTLADRDTWLTDADAMAADALEILLDPDHWASLAAQIDPSRTLAARALDAPAGGGTVYLATADRWGGAVSLIESNYAGFGSGIVDPETGIAYQNRGSFFSLDPQHANALLPGKRTMHTLAPGMLFREGRPWIVHGSMGGEIQPQVFAQFVSAVVDGALDVASAVAIPRWAADVEEHYGAPSATRLEGRCERAVAEALAVRGHAVKIGDDFDSSFGHEHAIEFVWHGPSSGGDRAEAQDGSGSPRPGAPMSFAATADPRSEGLPAAY
jgi:gamma-glutamyltranspeptidase/glutathione hydrolase